VLLDIKMPGMDGMEVLRKLHALDETLPVVMISGHGTTATAVDAIRPAPPTSSTSRSAASA
jgi:FixJ family two-component response regulator